MAEPTIIQMHLQDGYGAHKRREHCETCYDTTGRVGRVRVTYSDGSVRFFCEEHGPVASSPGPTAHGA
jgi:hypothetical protein